MQMDHARDRFGVKPLCYTRRPDGALWLASEAKALHALGHTARWDVDMLWQAAQMQYLSPDRTLFDGVMQLPPGHLLIASEHDLTLRPYWDLDYPTEPTPAYDAADEAAWIAATRDAIDEAVSLRLRADVLCLQEVDAQRPGAESANRSRRLEALEQLLEGTPYAAFHRALSLGLSGKRPADKHNLVILSRWPLIAWESLHHRLVPPPRIALATGRPHGSELDLQWDRPLLRVSVRLPNGRPLHLINLHLRAPLAAPVPGQRHQGVWRGSAGWAEGFYLASMKRAGQALEARLVVEELLDLEPDALVMVAGDLNAEEGEVPVRILRGAASDIEAPALAQRELLSLTRSLAREQRFSLLYNGRRALYDHLLASPSLAALFTRCEIHNEGLHDEGALPPGSPHSFHAPVLAEFALPGAG